MLEITDRTDFLKSATLVSTNSISEYGVLAWRSGYKLSGSALRLHLPDDTNCSLQLMALRAEDPGVLRGSLSFQIIHLHQ